MRIIGDKGRIIVGEAQKGLQLFDGAWLRPRFNHRYLGGVWFDTVPTHNVAQVLDFLGAKGTFGTLYTQRVGPQGCKHLSEVFFMLRLVAGEDENIVKIHGAELSQTPS